jgi:hypothetical protein
LPRLEAQCHENVMPQRVLLLARQSADALVHIAFDSAPIVTALQYGFAAKIAEGIEAFALLAQAERSRSTLVNSS